MSERSVIYRKPRFRLDVEADGDALVLHPVGVINEDVDFGDLLRILEGSGFKELTYRFDLSGVTAINSCGIREWILLLQKAQASRTVEFTRVPEVIVDHANIIPNILGKQGSHVDSFFVPFFNAETQERRMVLVSTKEFAPGGKKLDRVRAALPGGGSSWKVDAAEADYFGFLEHVKA